MKKMQCRYPRALSLGILLLSLNLVSLRKGSAQEQEVKAPPTPGPMLAQGTIDLETPDFTLKLVRSSQTVAALTTKGSEKFDFTPGDILVARSKNGYYHLGDLDLRLSWLSVKWRSGVLR